LNSNRLNFIFYATGIIASGVLSFLLIPVIVQLYGKEVYGSFSLMFNLLSLVCMLCYAWVGQSFIRFYNAKQPELFKVCKRLLNKSLMIGSVFFLVLLLFTTNLSLTTFILLLCTFLVFGYYCFLLLVFQALRKALVIMFCEVLRTGMNVFLAFIFIKIYDKKNMLDLLVLAMFLAYLLPTLILLYKTKFLNDSTDISTMPNNAKQLLSFGIPIAFFLSGSLALAVNDRFLISYLINHETAGAYSAIYDIINKGVIAVFSPILMTFYPEIAALYNSGKRAEAYKKIHKLVWYEIALIGIGFLFLLFLGNYLFNLIFENQAISQLTLIAVLIFIGVCLWQLAMLLHKPLELEQKTKQMAVAVFISLLINVCLNFTFIKLTSSLIVPAVTTIIGSVVYIIFIYYHSKKITY
jgi:O-antigen/teichoic acid export membrane protein